MGAGDGTAQVASFKQKLCEDTFNFHTWYRYGDVFKCFPLLLDMHSIAGMLIDFIFLVYFYLHAVQYLYCTGVPTKHLQPALAVCLFSYLYPFDIRCLCRRLLLPHRCIWISLACIYNHLNVLVFHTVLILYVCSAFYWDMFVLCSAHMPCLLISPHPRLCTIPSLNRTQTSPLGGASASESRWRTCIPPQTRIYSCNWYASSPIHISIDRL